MSIFKDLEATSFRKATDLVALRLAESRCVLLYVSIKWVFFGQGGVAEPVHEEEIEVAVAVGATIGGAVAGVKSGLVGLVRGVTIE